MKIIGIWSAIALIFLFILTGYLLLPKPDLVATVLENNNHYLSVEVTKEYSSYDVIYDITMVHRERENLPIFDENGYVMLGAALECEKKSSGNPDATETDEDNEIQLVDKKGNPLRPKDFEPGSVVGVWFDGIVQGDTWIHGTTKIKLIK